MKAMAEMPRFLTARAVNRMERDGGGNRQSHSPAQLGSHVAGEECIPA
jgi:hypothetical protein